MLSLAPGGMKPMAHHADVKTAWDLMEQAEENYLKNVSCPVSHAHALETVSMTRRHRCKFSALATMLLNEHSVEITKIYRYQNCGYDFKDLPEAKP